MGLRSKRPPKKGGMRIKIRGIPWTIFKAAGIREKFGIDGYNCPNQRTIALDALVCADPIDLSCTLFHELAHTWIGGAMNDLLKADAEETVVELIGNGMTEFLLENPKWTEAIARLPTLQVSALLYMEDKKEIDADD